jgi:integrase
MTLADTLANTQIMPQNASNPEESSKIVPLRPVDTQDPAGPEQPGKVTSRATSRRTLPARHFKYRGRRWRMYKRKADPEAAWWIELRRHGKRQPMSLGTYATDQAEAEAKLRIDLFMEKRETDLRRSMVQPGDRKYSTIAQVIAAVPELPITANAITRNSYVWSLRWVLRLALGLTDAEVDTQSAGVLNKATARAFFDRVAAAAAKMPTQAERNTYKRNAYTFYDNSRALFAPRPLESMRETLGLRLPEMTAWREGKKMYAEEVDAAAAFERPSDQIIRRTLVEWVRIGRTPGYQVTCGSGNSRRPDELAPLNETARRNMFIAIGLALSCGLRKSEIAKVRWEWFQTRNGHPQLCEYAVDVKNRSNRIDVRPVDPFWKILNRVIDRNGWRGSPGEHCLAQRPKVKGVHRALDFSHGGKSDRVYWLFYHVGKWLRTLGWRTQKTNHALRDYTASTITMKYGLERASSWCRHGQIATTQAHYSRFVDDEARDNPRLLQWFRWAKT